MKNQVKISNQLQSSLPAITIQEIATVLSWLYVMDLFISRNSVKKFNTVESLEIRLLMYTSDVIREQTDRQTSY